MLGAASEPGDEDAKQDRAFLHLMRSGLQMAEPSISGAVGAAIGLLGGPPGAVLGGMAGGMFSTVVKKLGSEMDKRLMGPRERARVSAVCALGASEIVRRVQAGEQIRSDGFFDEGEYGRSYAEEVWESLLSRCQREASERKLPYMSHLFAALAFDNSIGLDKAHQLIYAAEHMTYRQMCILCVGANRHLYELRAEKYTNESASSIWPIIEVLYECYDLYQKEYIHTDDKGVLGMTQITPSTMRPFGIGTDIYDLMKLSTLPRSHVDMIAKQLGN